MLRDADLVTLKGGVGVVQGKCWVKDEFHTVESTLCNFLVYKQTFLRDKWPLAVFCLGLVHVTKSVRLVNCMYTFN